jgi:hypothetical protein
MDGERKIIEGREKKKEKSKKQLSIDKDDA